MRKITVLLAMLCFMAVSLTAEVKTLVFACQDKEDFPSVVGNGDAILSEKPGAAIEFLRLLEKELGVKIEFVRLPWNRALEFELKNGSVDGLFSASYKKEREAFGVFPLKDGTPDTSKALYSTDYVFYKLKDSKLVWSDKTLKNLVGNIGAPRGFSIVDDLKAMGYPVEVSDGSLIDLKKLAAGRLGAVAALELSGDFLLEQNPDLSKAIVKVQPSIVSKPYYIMLSQQFVASNPELTARIWTAIGKLKGEYPKIAVKYLN